MPPGILDNIREFLGELPPKWSEVHEAGHPGANYHVTPSFGLDVAADDAHRFHDRPVIRTRHDIDQAVQKAAQAECDHHVNTTAILGGEPLTVSRCMMCGLVDWEDLREQADAYARRYAARLLEEVYGVFTYPDGSKSIAWVNGRHPLVNIQQVYNLFVIEPGTNTTAPEGS
jgi:hypothetical protein